MLTGSLLFLFSKCIIVISVIKDLFILNSAMFRKPDKNILIDIATFLSINSFLLFIYFFFFQGFNLVHQLFVEGGMVQVGNICGLISTIGGYWLMVIIYSHYDINKRGTKLECLSRLLFYPASSFLVYIFTYLISNLFIIIFRAV